MVSNASDDFPEPDSPVNTINWSRGSSRSTLRRLCSRAPRITIVLLDGAATGSIVPGARPNRTNVRLGRTLQADDVREAVGPRRGPTVRGRRARPVARESQLEGPRREQPDAPGGPGLADSERGRVVDTRRRDPVEVAPLLDADP